MMFLRRATVVLFRRITQTASFPNRTSLEGLSPLISDQKRSSYQYGRLLWIFLSAQPAVLFGYSSYSALADGNVTGLLPENDAGGPNMSGLQKVEDGSVVSNEHTSKWRIFTDQGRELFMQGKLDDAEKLFRSALEEAKRGFGERDPHVASSCNNLAELYRVRKSYDKAEPLYGEAINILEESFGKEDVRVGAALHNLGQFYLVQRKLEDARICYERALKIKGRVLGHGHFDYADTMYHLGTVLYLQGKENDAEAFIQDSVRILEESGQGETYICMRRLRYLSQIYLKSNRLEEAANLQRKILHIMELTKGWSSLETVIAAENLAMTLQAAGNLKDAQEFLQRCLEARKLLLPENHIQISANMLSLARLLMLKLKEVEISDATSQIEQARGLLRDSVRIAQHVLDRLMKQKQTRRSYSPRDDVGRSKDTTLIVLLQALNALGSLEIMKQESLKSGEMVASSEPARIATECICSFRKYTADRQTPVSMEVKTEYVSCLKLLVQQLIRDDVTPPAQITMRIGSVDVSVQELEDEVKQVEAEIQQVRKR